MSEPEFTCARCRGTFLKGWPEEEARAEKDRDYPTFAVEECAVLCDDCYHEYRKFELAR